MNKKTIIEELLSYKISKTDIKTLSDTLIFAQLNNYNFKLKDLLSLYYKKVNIDDLLKQLKIASANNIKIDAPKFLNTKLTKDDFINHIKGWIYASRKKVNTTIFELYEFAAAKTDIKFLVDSFLELKKMDDSLEIKDFTGCNFCLYKTHNFIETLKKIKSEDTNVSLKKILALKLPPYDLDNIFNQYKKLSLLNSGISITQLFDLKVKNTDVNNITEAYIIAQDQDIKIDFNSICKINKKGHDAKQIIINSFLPITYILKPVSVILKTNVEILLKLKIVITSDLENIVNGIPKEFLDNKIQEYYKAEIGKYENTNEVYVNFVEISESVLKKN